MTRAVTPAMAPKAPSAIDSGRIAWTAWNWSVEVTRNTDTPGGETFST